VSDYEFSLQGNDSFNLLRLAVERYHFFAGPYSPFCGDAYILGGSGKPGGKGSSFEQFSQFIHSGNRSDELEHIGTRPSVEFIEFSLQAKEIFQEKFLSALQESFLSQRQSGEENRMQNRDPKDGSIRWMIYNTPSQNKTISSVWGAKMLGGFCPPIADSSRLTLIS
jgi:hypothetical protein